MSGFRKLTDELFVGPQLTKDDFAKLASAGIKSVINNRPDGEGDNQLSSAQAAKLAKSEGLAYSYIPFAINELTPEHVADFKAALAELPAPTVAYCASGMRSAVVWALGAAGSMPVEQIVSRAGNAGFDLSNLVPMLQALEQQRVSGR